MASSSGIRKGPPIALESKRRNKTRPLFPVDFVDLLFQAEGNPFLFQKNLKECEKDLPHFLWWHAGHLINCIMKDGCTPKFILHYFSPYINKNTRKCILQPLTRSLITLLQSKWSFVCSTVANDLLLASEDGQKMSDETMHLRDLFRKRKTTLVQVSGAVYEVLGWAAFHSGMRKQAELLWKCGSDKGHPGCLIWLAVQVPPLEDAPHQHVFRDPKAEAEQALRFIHAAAVMDRHIPYHDNYMPILQYFLNQFEESSETLTQAEDDPLPDEEPKTE